MAAAMNPAGPGWIGAQQISNNNLVYPAVIAANEPGKAIAVWTQDDGAPEQYGVWVNWYTPMKGWAQPKRINDYVGQADEIAVALNNEGQAVVTWVQYSLSDFNNPAPVTTSLWVSRFDQDWTTPLKLVDDALNPLFPKVAMAENGDIIEVWDQVNSDLDNTNVYASIYTRNVGWSAERLVQASTDISSVTPSIAMNGHGDALVYWQQFNPAPDYTANIGYNYYSQKTGWKGADAIPASEDAGEPKAGVDEHGNAMLAFGKSYPNVIYAVSYDTQTGWRAPTLLQDPNNGTDISASNLAFAMNEDGNAFAIWKESAFSYFGDTTHSIHTNHFVPGKGWQGQQMIGTDASNRTVYDQLVPQIGVDDRGNAITIWAQENGPEYYAPTHMLAYHYNNIQGWDAGQTLQLTTNSANNGQLTVTENGQAFAAWIEEKSVDFNVTTSVWVNHYLAAPMQ